jgi:tRNA (guanine-N7-)-methyltransferase
VGDGEGRAGPAHPGPSRKFYGRLRGKALRPSRQRLMEELLPRLAVPGVRRGGASGSGSGSDAGSGDGSGLGESLRSDSGAGLDGGLGEGLGEGRAPHPGEGVEAGQRSGVRVGSGDVSALGADSGSGEASGSSEEAGAAQGLSLLSGSGDALDVGGGLGDASGEAFKSGETSGDGAGSGRGETVDLAALFGDARPVWLEIGFGGGEHLVHQAALHPEVGLIGAEPFVNGVAMALARIEAAGLGNVRIHAADARDLLDQLPERGIARVFLLYPDPWPKTRHWDRRFMNPDNLAALARVMAPGAELRLATDIAEYARHAVRAAEIAGGFALQGGPRDWERPWPDWVTTRFEARARREGRGSQYLTFVRL